MKGLATIVKGGICKTNISYRPSPSLFYFPGLSSSPVYKVGKIKEGLSTTIPSSPNSVVLQQRLMEIKETLESN